MRTKSLPAKSSSNKARAAVLAAMMRREAVTAKAGYASASTILAGNPGPSEVGALRAAELASIMGGLLNPD